MSYDYERAKALTESELILSTIIGRLRGVGFRDTIKDVSITGGETSEADDSINSYFVTITYFVDDDLDGNDYGQSDIEDEVATELEALFIEEVISGIASDFALFQRTLIDYELVPVKRAKEFDFGE